MSGRRTIRAAMLAAALLCAAGGAHAQQVTTPQRQDRSGPNVGYAYGWSGGGTIGADGHLQMNEHARVTQIVPGSLGERVGLRVGDVIVSVNGRDTRQSPLFRGIRRGDTIVLRIRRGDEEREISYVWQPNPRQQPGGG